MSKSNPKDAPEPRVEPLYTNLARKLAVMLLWLASEYPHPRQQALIAEHMAADAGFDLGHLVRVRGELAFRDLEQLSNRLLDLDEIVRKERHSEHLSAWGSLADEVDEIVELAKSGKGGGSHE